MSANVSSPPELSLGTEVESRDHRRIAGTIVAQHRRLGSEWSYAVEYVNNEGTVCETYFIREQLMVSPK